VRTLSLHFMANVMAWSVGKIFQLVSVSFAIGVMYTLVYRF